MSLVVNLSVLLDAAMNIERVYGGRARDLAAVAQPTVQALLA
jgi:hypothetical protein